MTRWCNVSLECVGWRCTWLLLWSLLKKPITFSVIAKTVVVTISQFISRSSNYINSHEWLLWTLYGNLSNSGREIQPYECQIFLCYKQPTVPGTFMFLFFVWFTWKKSEFFSACSITSNYCGDLDSRIFFLIKFISRFYFPSTSFMKLSVPLQYTLIQTSGK